MQRLLQFALIRAEWLRIRLVKGCFSGTEARGRTASTTGTFGGVFLVLSRAAGFIANRCGATGVRF